MHPDHVEHRIDAHTEVRATDYLYALSSQGEATHVLFSRDVLLYLSYPLLDYEVVTLLEELDIHHLTVLLVQGSHLNNEILEINIAERISATDARISDITTARQVYMYIGMG